ncbi:MAG: adenylate/guanylate cyclase domain-containing protein [Myxococcota bacterium]
MHRRRTLFSRLPLLAKVLLAVNFVLVVAVASTGVSTFSVARDAMREGVITSGKRSVEDFARGSTLEFLDPDRGPLDIELRLRGLVSDASEHRPLAAYAVDREGKIIASAGSSVLLPIDEIRALTTSAVVESPTGSIVVGTPVTYDEVVLGYIAFAFDNAMIAEAGTTIVIQVVVVVLAFLLANVLLLWLLVRRLLRPVVQLGEAAEALASGDYTHPLPENLPEDEIGRAARSFENMRDALTVHMRFSNAALVERIRTGRLVDEGDEHQLSVVFGDAAGYTAWSQNRAAQEVFSTLSRYYTCMGRIMVDHCGGIIDKFIGDGVMLHFGLMRQRSQVDRSPAVVREHVQAALRGACYSQIALRALSHALERFQGRDSLRYRFGIASGRCLVGPFGARDVMLDYSLIGNVVNLAARLEALSPPGGLIVDRFTYVDAGEGFLEVESGGIQRVKGVEMPIQVFFVKGLAGENERKRMRDYLLEELFDDEFVSGVILDGDDDAEKMASIRSFLEAEIDGGASLPCPPRNAAAAAEEAG